MTEFVDDEKSVPFLYTGNTIDVFHIARPNICSANLKSQEQYVINSIYGKNWYFAEDTELPRGKFCTWLESNIRNKNCECLWPSRVHSTSMD
jgi:hypothetical protein